MSLYVFLDSGSHKVQHFFNAISLKIKANLLTIDGPPENSSDLERAAAARSIADEFSGGPSIVNALQRCENTRFHIHTAPFGILSPKLKAKPKAQRSRLRLNVQG